MQKTLPYAIYVEIRNGFHRLIPYCKIESKSTKIHHKKNASIVLIIKQPAAVL